VPANACSSGVRSQIGTDDFRGKGPSLRILTGRNSTVQSQSFSSPQYGSKSSLSFVPMVLVSGSCKSASKLAIHRRYTERRFLCIPYCYLQGITVRPVPCNYNVIQSVSALSRRRRGFKSRRGRQFNNLGEKCLLSSLTSGSKIPGAVALN